MEGSDKKKIVVVCGPTASGKSSLALALCHAFNGELIGADSMQIYQGLTIGTAALTEEEAEGIPQHLVGFLPPDQLFSVAQYQQLAIKKIEEVLNRGRLPVLCGGTGLYISSIVKGTRFTEQPTPASLRQQMEDQWQKYGPTAMLEKLAQLDPVYAAKLHENDKKRILRGLELFKATGSDRETLDALSQPEEPPFNALCISPSFPERQLLYNRINARVDQMLAEGLLKEAELVYQNKTSYKTAVQAIGYKELFPFMEGSASLEACTDKLKQATRNYAKRQITWFKKMEEIHFIEGEGQELKCKVEKLVNQFLFDENQ